MQTGWLHFNEAQLRDSQAQIMREVYRDVQTESTLCQSTKMTMKEKSTLLTM